MKRTLVRFAAGIVACTLAVSILPRLWCSRGAERWIAGDLDAQRSLARGVEHLVLNQSLDRSHFHTGSSQFNGEWLFGSYLMAGIGFAQMAREHPDLRAAHEPLVTQCIERLIAPDVRAFDAESWGEDPLLSLDGSNAHAAYLGYLNLLLGLHRSVFNATNYAGLNDRITAALVRRVSASPIVLVESYPREVYPIDNCFVIGSIGLHQKASGSNHSDVVALWVARVRKDYVDNSSGLLVQAVDAHTGAAVDAPRGSGTALGLCAVQYADPALARDLYSGIKRSLASSVLGFGAVREYPPGFNGSGDIDSGPVILSFGLSATGFSFAGARMFGDSKYFTRLYASAHLFGAPAEREGRRAYISGGSLGNAILFAMMTAPRVDSP